MPVPNLRGDDGLWLQTVRVQGKRYCTELGRKWSSLLKRIGKVGNYAGASLEFTDFQDFAEWAVQQVGHDQGFDIDKDLIVQGNMTYGKAYCVFIPDEINGFLVRRSTKREYKFPPGVNPCHAHYRKDGYERKERYSVYCGEDYLGVAATPLCGLALYKSAKEAKAKYLANKWRDQIDPRAYNALMTYTVEIAD